jgi:hypothetical protein
MEPKFIAARVYLKPLLPRLRRGITTDDVLRRIRQDLLRRVKKTLLQTTFSDRAKKALHQAIKVEVKPSSLRITAKHPAFGPLVAGQRKGQMKWLAKAKRPIPIITEKGELIFRNATPRSMERGSWIHPGREPSDFVEKAKKATREFMQEKLPEEFGRKLKRMAK